jgi:hypothetical protein
VKVLLPADLTVWMPKLLILFISNHRDIILDTSLLNVALYENNLLMTASAIGDNLVHKPFFAGPVKAK